MKDLLLIHVKIKITIQFQNADVIFLFLKNDFTFVQI